MSENNSRGDGYQNLWGRSLSIHSMGWALPCLLVSVCGWCIAPSAMAMQKD